MELRSDTAEKSSVLFGAARDGTSFAHPGDGQDGTARDVMSLCTISGTVLDPAGAAVENAMVRYRLVNSPFNDGSSNTSILANVTWTNSSGVWTASLPQGSIARIEVRECGIDKWGTVPSESTHSFTSLEDSWSNWIE